MKGRYVVEYSGSDSKLYFIGGDTSLSSSYSAMKMLARPSKFSHVYCDTPKPETCFQNLRPVSDMGDQNYIKVNSLFLAIGLQSGPLAVIPLNKPGILKSDIPTFCGHSAPVLDFDFNPFHDHIIATGSEDATIKIWGIPKEGITSTISQPLVTLSGHYDPVSLLKFHPTAENVVVSASEVVKMWDTEKGSEINSYSDNSDLIQDITWDFTGRQYATASKDKVVRMIDARSATLAGSIKDAHEAAKSVKLAYLGAFNKLLSVGFTKVSMRQFKIWDPRNTSQELVKVNVDQSRGVLMPLFDPDTGLLFLAGKGEGNVRYYEVVNEAPYVYPVSDYESDVPTVGMAWVPKRSLDVMGCEIARLMKLTPNSVDPLSFHVPRKSGRFQEDLYPDTISGKPSYSADEWLAGADLPPPLMSLNPNRGDYGDDLQLALSNISITLAPATELKRQQHQQQYATVQQLESLHKTVREVRGTVVHVMEELLAKYLTSSKCASDATCGWYDYVFSIRKTDDEDVVVPSDLEEDLDRFISSGLPCLEKFVVELERPVDNDEKYVQRSFEIFMEELLVAINASSVGLVPKCWLNFRNREVSLDIENFLDKGVRKNCVVNGKPDVTLLYRGISLMVMKLKDRNLLQHENDQKQALAELAVYSRADVKSLFASEKVLFPEVVSILTNGRTWCLLTTFSRVGDYQNIEMSHIHTMPFTVNWLSNDSSYLQAQYRRVLTLLFVAWTSAVKNLKDLQGRGVPAHSTMAPKSKPKPDSDKAPSKKTTSTPGPPSRSSTRTANSSTSGGNNQKSKNQSTNKGGSSGGGNQKRLAVGTLTQSALNTRPSQPLPMEKAGFKQHKTYGDLFREICMRTNYTEVTVVSAEDLSEYL